MISDALREAREMLKMNDDWTAQSGPLSYEKDAVFTVLRLLVAVAETLDEE